MITEVKQHRVRHGNVMDGLDELMKGKLVDLFYSDPPWGQGNLNYWQTMNNKMNGSEKSEINLDEFIDQIFSIGVKYSKNLIFIEYGVKWEQQIRSYGEKHGLLHIGLVTLQYKSGSRLLPLHLHIFAKHPVILPEGYVDNLHMTYGLDTLKKALYPFAKEGNTILDPCCGMGYTAQIAVNTKMIFRGNELNKARLAKTIKRLSK